MTSPLFRHEIQIRLPGGNWAQSVWDHDHDGTFDAACVQRDHAQRMTADRMRYRIATVLVPPCYEIQLRTSTGRWLPSAHNNAHDGTWLGATRAFQAAVLGATHPYRVVQVDA